VDYGDGDGKAYSGTRRAIELSLAASFFSRGLGGTETMGDLRAELVGHVPLPLLKRQTLRLFVRGRLLPNAPDGLLTLGGQSFGLLELGNPTGPAAGPSPLALPGGIAFSEPLRGFEDSTFRARHAVIAGARYRYPFIIDKGWASTLYLLPSFFLRQVDVELFAESAYTDQETNPSHTSAGAAVFLKTAFGGGVPLALFYQFALRDDGLAPLHLIGLAAQ
jgi:hypothetical protein